jgi:DNA-binding MarR family transcriptional regulator
MESDGLVKKVKETPKSNKLRFELTEKGRIACKEVKNINSLVTIMSALSEEERRQLIALLEKIINRAQEFHQSLPE